jgi:hypothetical protein
VIFTERLGPNAKGVIHGSTGISGWSPQVDLTPILSEGSRRGVASDCADGMATVASTDVVASVSNWGAYAIEACLAHLLGDAELPQPPELARRVIDPCFAGGGYEAICCTQRDLVDGIASATSVGLTHILKEMVRISLLSEESGPAH